MNGCGRSVSGTLFSVVFFAVLAGIAGAQDIPDSGELVAKAWAAHAKKNAQKTFEYADECIRTYSSQADSEQASLKAIPLNKSDIKAVHVLNDVAAAYFIEAESFRQQGRKDDAARAFKTIVEKYPYAQAWDPRGWYWLVADSAQDSLAQLTGRPVGNPVPEAIPTKVVLYDRGKEDMVDYLRYGTFENTGTPFYRYVIKDRAGLSAAVGEGIYPNTASFLQDPAYKEAKGRSLTGAHCTDLLYSSDLESAFLQCVEGEKEDEGANQFYTAQVLEKSGLIRQAVKAYYAIVVHFPASYGWTYLHTKWYPGQVAIASIRYLLRKYPRLGMKLVGADIKVIDEQGTPMVFADPGQLEKTNIWDSIEEMISPLEEKWMAKIKRHVGGGDIYLVQFDNGDWQLRVDGKPFMIRGTTYAPTKVGESPDDGTMTNWMYDDFNHNGKIDGPYDAFVDKNRDNVWDKDEPAVGDFELMKEMGVNTIRWYHQPFRGNKKLLRDLFKNYGIRVIIGDFLGQYALGSGAPWYPGTDYTNPQQRKNMMDSVLSMVREFKDEPYVLFWLLGNENVYGGANNADKHPDAFFKFANEMAKEIKKIDPHHLVAIGNGDTVFLDKFAKDCPDIDIFGANSYRGEIGFGRLWKDVKEIAGKPVVITEYGAPAYADNKGWNAEELQSEYLEGATEDIERNAAFQGEAGNSIGGLFFEWVDEWWKQYGPWQHDIGRAFPGPFPGGYMYEEWLGVTSQGNGKYSPFLRQLRPAYYMFKRHWNKNILSIQGDHS